MTGRVAAACLVALLLASIACGPARRIRDSFVPPSPTPTPAWVGKVQETGTPIATFQSRVAEVEPRTGRPVSAPIALRETPGRGADPNGFTVQPGERVFLNGVELVGGERFYRVRSFDGLRRGWLPESALAPDARPAGS